MTKPSKKQLALGIVAALLIALFGGLWFAGDYFVEYSMGRKPVELIDPLSPSYDATPEELEHAAIADALVRGWLDTSSTHEVNLTSHDGLNLYGVQYDSTEPTDRWVIAVHGYTSRHPEMQDIAYEYHQRGYNAITPDLRGHGASDGDYTTLGLEDAKDILTWIDYILSLNPNAEIVLHGVSMGAATVMMTAGEATLPDNVIAVIEDCGYTSAYQMMVEQLDFRFGLPGFPIVDFSRLVSIAKAGYDFADVMPIEALEHADVPILFIHGDADTYVGFYMLDELYNAYDGVKEKLVVEGAEHGAARRVAPELYYHTVFDFIEHNGI